MDDPWANAWGDPSSKSAHTTPPPTWIPPSPSPHQPPLQHPEADLAAPSWSTGPGIKWDEPSVAAASLWNNDSVSDPTWAPPSSPYDSIPLRSASPQSNLKPFEPSQSSPDPPQVLSLPVTSNSDQPVDDFGESPSFSPIQPVGDHSDPASPDAFGTFETAILADDVDVDPWTPAQPSFPPTESTGTDAWTAPAWDAPQSSSAAEEDEWEVAKQQKEKLDLHVPPELLASIFRQIEELSTDLWPSEDPDLSSNGSWQSNSMQSLDLTSVANKLIPNDLILPPIVQFSQTFACKRTTETLRLTRNLPITGLSPMTFYISSKGSTSWEASVKSRPDKTEDDATPAGWRLMEKGEEDMPQVDDGKKKTGGLFSFFGKRTSAAPETNSAARAASPIRASASSTPRPSVAGTPRVSTDSIKPGNKFTNQIAAGEPPSATPSLKSPTSSTFQSPTTQNQSDIFSPTGISSPLSEEVRPATPVAPAPSAVSRFWGRFSRNKPSAGSPHNSVALTSDDLEFLSDIVPTASDLDNGDDGTLGALTNMIQSSPLPTKLPPPLAPPPKAPPPISAPKVPPSDVDTFASFFETPAQPAGLPTVIPPTTPPRGQALLQPIPPPVDITSSSSIVTTSAGNADWPAFDFDEPPAPASSIARPTSALQPRPASRARSPLVPPKRAFTAVMSNAPTRSSSPASIPKLNASNLSLNLPPPSHVSVPLANSSIPFIPPPPSSRTQTPLTSALVIAETHSALPKSQPAHEDGSATFDDDEFSDFLSSPAHPTPSNSFTSGFFSTSSSQPLTSTGGTSFQSDFDDFDDFVSPSLPTPSPPKPPSKSPLTFDMPGAPEPVITARASHIPKPLAPRKALGAADHQRTLSLMESASRGRWLAPPSPLPMAIPPPEADNQLNHVTPGENLINAVHTVQQPPQEKAATAVAQSSHQRTLSLLESAAARGKWPAPPSPLPMAIPPPDTHNHSRSNIDLLDGGHNMQEQQAKALAALNSSVLSPGDAFGGRLSQPTSVRSSSPSMSLLAPPSSSWIQPRAMENTVNDSSTRKTGGLSAQDLSFFEGL